MSVANSWSIFQGVNLVQLYDRQIGSLTLEIGLINVGARFQKVDRSANLSRRKLARHIDSEYDPQTLHPECLGIGGVWLINPSKLYIRYVQSAIDHPPEKGSLMVR